MTEGEALAREHAAALLAGDRMAAHLGIEVVDVGPGRATVRMRITDAMLNGVGTVHGGVVFTLADIAYAAACNSHGRLTVGRSAEVIHVAPAHAGEVLIAVATERSRRGRNGVYDVSVEREDGAPIAEFRAQSRTVA
ncbi:MAG TPA: hydroxyphenylacetyl-CoA thioesterase PaaI [Candidatus Dormibacteraeota bacterium]